MIIIEENELRKLGVEKKVISLIQKHGEPVENEEDLSIQDEVDSNAKATAELAKAVKELASSPKPSGKPQDLTPILEAIQNLQESQLNVLQLLEKKVTSQPKPRSFEFLVSRNKHGSIHKITAKESVKS